MSKEFKLKKYIAADSVKEILGIVATDVGDAINEGLYIAGQKGSLSASDEISSTGYFLDERWFSREYQPNNPDLYSDGFEMNVQLHTKKFKDVVQFDSFAFNLTEETLSGNLYKLDQVWHQDPHHVVLYKEIPEDRALTGERSSEIDLVISGTVIGGISDESPVYAYGLVSGGTLLLYSKYALSGNLSEVYAPETHTDLPFAYLFEQNLDIGVQLDDLSVYGISAGPWMYVKNALISLPQAYSPQTNDQNPERIYLIPFKLKNMYNYNWNTEINRPSKLISGLRDYIAVGKTQGAIWLSYYYVRDSYTGLENYQLVERIRGLYKYKGASKHKSNIYSIQIRNSYLNDSTSDSTAIREVKTELRAVIEESVRKVAVKIAPNYTQLWKIDWYGK